MVTVKVGVIVAVLVAMITGVAVAAAAGLELFLQFTAIKAVARRNATIKAWLFFMMISL
jgi:hypothetical protein